MSNRYQFCFKKDCYWNESQVEERLNFIKAQKEQGVIVVEEKPLCLFYKSKLKLTKDQKNKCAEETLCQVHYFQKKINGEACKECQQSHDYEKIQPELIKMYQDKKREIQSSDNKNERLFDYLNAYLYHEAKEYQQQKQLQLIIQQEKSKAIDNKKKTADIKNNADIFSLKQCYAENLPNVQIITQDVKKDQQYSQASGFDKKVSYDKGICQLLKRYQNK